MPVLMYRPEVNQRISKAAHIKELNTEIDKLKEELFATREKNGVYLPADHWESQQVLFYACLCCIQLAQQLCNLARQIFRLLSAVLALIVPGQPCLEAS